MGMQVRGLPSSVAFSAKIGGFVGLWYHTGSVTRLGRAVAATMRPRADAMYHLTCLHVRAVHNGEEQPFARILAFRADTEVVDYDGPLDLRVKVKGYSPKRPKGQSPSYVLVIGERGPDLSKGPRKVRLREDEEELEFV
jgi:hypothetical protein